MEELQTAQNLVNAPCNACGGKMLFNATKQMMECENCGNTREVPRATDQIVERSFSDALSMENQDTSGLGVARKQIACKTCGAHTTIPADAVTVECDFCGSKNINEEAHNTRTIKPQGLLPFKVEKKQAVEKFREWIGKGFFYASGLKKVTGVDEIKPVYVPFWTYDAHTDSSWTADAGYYYYVTKTVTGSDGKETTVQERRVRWEPAWGNFSHHFDDVTVIASKGITQNAVERIYPYDLPQLVNYAPEYLLGKNAEVYALDVKEGYKVADGIMDRYIEAECAKMIPGDTYRDLRVNTHKHGITFKHILLPIWIAAYIFNNKSYQVIVNGQTGKISGEKPLSWFKIILTAAIVIGLCVGGYFLYKHYKG